MQRWIASAAGGTSQRLKPGLAMVADRSSQPSPVAAVTQSSPSCSFLPFLSALRRLLFGAGRCSCFRIAKPARRCRVERDLVARPAPRASRRSSSASRTCGYAWRRPARACVRRQRREVVADLVGHAGEFVDLAAAHAAALRSQIVERQRLIARARSTISATPAASARAAAPARSARRPRPARRRRTPPPWRPSRRSSGW